MFSNCKNVTVKFRFFANGEGRIPFVCCILAEMGKRRRRKYIVWPIHPIVHWLPDKRLVWPQSCEGFVNMAHLIVYSPDSIVDTDTPTILLIVLPQIELFRRTIHANAFPVLTHCNMPCLHDVILWLHISHVRVFSRTYLQWGKRPIS
jgi:hypothetical protein